MPPRYGFSDVTTEPREEEFVKKHRQPTNLIEIKKYLSEAYGALPPYLGLSHRHLEKERPKPTDSTDGIPGIDIISYNIPLDLIRMIIGDSRAAQMESAVISYRRSPR